MGPYVRLRPAMTWLWDTPTRLPTFVPAVVRCSIDSHEGVTGTSVSDHAGEAQRRLYTIGHSNHPLDTFIGLLEAHAIQVLVDVRSQPYSKYTPHFESRPLKAAVTAREIIY